MTTHIYLLHGKGGSPAGSVSQLEAELRPAFPDGKFTRPLLRHNDPEVLAEDSLAALAEIGIPKGAVVIGISLGGLIAAKLQEDSRPDLKVICVSSPTWADGVKIQKKMPNRAAIYSSNDDVIQGRTAEWPKLAKAFDVPTLTHDTDAHKALIARGIIAYLCEENVKAALQLA